MVVMKIKNIKINNIKCFFRNIKYSFLFFTILIFLSSCNQKNPLLLSPEKSDIKSEQFKQITLGKAGKFSWAYDDKRYVAGWNAGGEEFYFSLEYFDKLPDFLSEKEKEKFSLTLNVSSELKKEVNGNLIDIYEISYGNFPIKKNKSKSELDRISLKKKTELELRRRFKDALSKPKPGLLDLDELVSIINEKKVIFLTGAGISFVAKIPTVETLKQSLGISENELVDSFVKNLLENREKLVKVMQEFLNAVVHAKPTPAHYALTKIVMKKSCQIMTGNFDFLHEKSGVKAYNVEMNSFEKDWNEKVIKEIDAIICIGTSNDFNAILGKYKKFNPDGVIIAINKEQPDYLGSEDFLITGDIQKIIPELAELLID